MKASAKSGWTSTLLKYTIAAAMQPPLWCHAPLWLVLASQVKGWVLRFVPAALILYLIPVCLHVRQAPTHYMYIVIQEPSVLHSHMQHGPLTRAVAHTSRIACSRQAHTTGGQGNHLQEPYSSTFVSLAGGKGGRCVSAGCAHAGVPWSLIGSGRGAVLHGPTPIAQPLTDSNGSQVC